MSNVASTFNPKDNSLIERVNAFRAVLQENHNIELSLKYKNDKEWLGTTEEIKYAQQVTQNSLQQAVKSLNKVDLQEAKTLGILSPEEAQQAKVLKAKSDLNNLSNSHSQKTHDSHSKKQ